MLRQESVDSEWEMKSEWQAVVRWFLDESWLEKVVPSQQDGRQRRLASPEKLFWELAMDLRCWHKVLGSIPSTAQIRVVAHRLGISAPQKCKQKGCELKVLLSYKEFWNQCGQHETLAPQNDFGCRIGLDWDGGDQLESLVVAWEWGWRHEDGYSQSDLMPM